ncbi:hypothetical protein MA04_02496 [Alcanivorax balearicus MACL04]|uniref:Uncharacterized protein n=1 Tax=Alloalcanivorax balearicus MACL04 TaxID=1177182 RepID=A0ABT2R088_9GAMM|nr:hypothetical protein [Alloalcanivorax balearicus]MCU5783196.1 hypothetical protein [Alloalcanivorax balearicus MACL04]
MLNKLAKLALVSTALAPICLTLWFVEINSAWQHDASWPENLANHWLVGSSYLLAALVLSALCFGLVWLSASRHGLERLPVKIKSVKTVDKEIVGFLLVYLMPLINQSQNTISVPVLMFVAVVFFFIVYNSHAYHFNPLLGFFRYHFFEVTIEGDITYVLITRQNITDCKSVSQVVQLTEYMILDTKHAQ